MEKLKRFWKNFKVRMSLLRILFMKNIVLLIKIACVVCFICVFTGVIKSDTPILGGTVYRLFAPLADEINAKIAAKEIGDIMAFLSVSTSLLFTISMFALKARGIAQSDIKNPKLKYAMIQANLYFNENGKLVKRIEQATGEDINLDGKINGEDAVIESSKHNIFKGIISAIQEFITIMRADFGDTDEELESEYERVIKEADLEEAKEATDEIDKIVSEGVNNMAVDNIVEFIDDEITETLEDEEISEAEATEKIGIMSKVKNYFSGLRKNKTNKTEEINEEPEVVVVEDNMDQDSEIDEVEEEQPSVTVEENKTEETETKVVEQPSAPKTNDSATEFLNMLRRRTR